MAYLPGRTTPFGDNKSSSSLTFEEFVPPSAWTEDSTYHYLLVDLPGILNFHHKFISKTLQIFHISIVITYYYF